MTWPGTIATMVGWWALCTAISVDGWREGFIVGAVSFVVIVGGRWWIERG